jgi:shikimate dehydrogenase
MSSSPPQPVVTGATRLYGIMGDPVAQVKSPGVFNPRIAAAGVDAVLVPLHVRSEAFDETVRGLMRLGNLDGLIATVPHKLRMLALADRVLPTGVQVGAINAMRRERDGTWTGDMFDGRGLVRGVRDQGIAVEGRRSLVIGTGGAGSAVAVALAEAGASAVTLHDLDQEKAEALAARIRQAYPGCRVEVGPPAVEGHDMLINATPIGMAVGDGLPVPLPRLDPEIVVVDVINQAEPTPLLAHAQACGCQTVDGRAMLAGQAEELARFFGFTGAA